MAMPFWQSPSMSCFSNSFGSFALRGMTRFSDIFDFFALHRPKIDLLLSFFSPFGYIYIYIYDFDRACMRSIVHNI
jgi:hypothetical protein